MAKHYLTPEGKKQLEEKLNHYKTVLRPEVVKEIGASSVILVVKLFKGKGTIPVWTRRNKKDLSKQMAKIGQNANAEAANEQVPENDHYGDSNERFAPPQPEHDEKPSGLFDEEIK